MKVKGKVVPIRDHVLVSDMEFGEQVTASGIVIKSDNGKSSGVKPRWGRVWAIGPEQTEVKVGEWIMIEHGRWTRKVKINDGENDLEIQKVEVKSIIAVSDEKVIDVVLGKEYDNSPAKIRPEEFAR